MTPARRSHLVTLSPFHSLLRGAQLHKGRVPRFYVDLRAQRFTVDVSNDQVRAGRHAAHGAIFPPNRVRPQIFIVEIGFHMARPQRNAPIAIAHNAHAATGPGAAIRSEQAHGHGATVVQRLEPQIGVDAVVIGVGAQTHFHMQVRPNGNTGHAHLAHHVAHLHMLPLADGHLV